MLPEEIETLFDKIDELWPNWNPNKAEITLMKEFLSEQPDYEKTGKAIGNHRKASRFRTPSHVGIKQELYSLSASRGEIAGLGYQDSNSDHSRYYIKCIKAPDAFPGRLGRKVDLWWPRGKMPEDLKTQWNIGEQMRVNHERLYGGEWGIYDYEETANG